MIMNFLADDKSFVFLKIITSFSTSDHPVNYQVESKAFSQFISMSNLPYPIL